MHLMGISIQCLIYKTRRVSALFSSPFEKSAGPRISGISPTNLTKGMVDGVEVEWLAPRILQGPANCLRIENGIQIKELFEKI